MKITFTSHDYKLAGNLFPAGNPQNLAFLLIQGWIGVQNVHAAQALAALGFTSMTYDMRGNRDSEGSLAGFSRGDFVADAVVAYDYLKQQVDQGTAIGVIGSSFGSYTATLLSEQRPVRCLSLRVPASYPDEGFHEPQAGQSKSSDDFLQWRQKKMDYAENHALLALHKFHGPVQIIRAGADEQLPAQVAENYANAVADRQQLTYDVMEDAPHTLKNEQLQAEYEKLLTTWVAQSGRTDD